MRRKRTVRKPVIAKPVKRKPPVKRPQQEEIEPITVTRSFTVGTRLVTLAMTILLSISCSGGEEPKKPPVEQPKKPPVEEPKRPPDQPRKPPRKEPGQKLPITGRVWFVRPGGGRARDGSSYESGWAGFDGIDWSKIAPGSTLYVCGRFNDELRIRVSGSEQERITIRGDYDGDPAVIASPGVAISVEGCSFVNLESLSIDRSGASGINAQFSRGIRINNCKLYRVGGRDDFGIDGRYAQAMVVDSCELTNERGAFGATGICVNLGTPNPEPSVVRNCYIHAIEVDGIVAGDNASVIDNVVGDLTNTATHADGIVVQGSSVVVARNIAYNCTQNIYVNSFDYGAGSSCVCDNVVVADNLVFGTEDVYRIGTNGICVDVETAGVASIRNLKLYNNTVADLNYRGFAIGDRGHGAERLAGLDIRNNLAVNCGEQNTNFDFDISERPANMVMDYNLTINTAYEHNGPNYSWNGKRYTLDEWRSAFGLEAHGASNPSGDIFRKYAYGASGNDYRLAALSPAGRAGVNLGQLYDTDFNGARRGDPWGVGCYAI